MLQFDHLPEHEKLYNVSYLARDYGINSETFKNEVAKCEVVCANCHMIQTGNRSVWLRSVYNGV